LYVLGVGFILANLLTQTLGSFILDILGILEIGILEILGIL
jgi:hypothetical protein